MRLFAISIVAFLIAATGAYAGGGGPVYDKPMYDPASKSYIELVHVRKAEAPGSEIPSLNFEHALASAASRTYKGVRGRLAVVDNQATHEFILLNFRPDTYTWIGLRYFCKLHKLQWTNGESMSRSSFQAWHVSWDQSGNAGCVRNVGEADWMPVAYTGVSEGFRWVAKGAKKLYTALLVQYPTGKP